ncbi:MAG: hypothetical protein ACTSUB_08675 [Candidatus Thorarchaeota archaeon]
MPSQITRKNFYSPIIPEAETYVITVDAVKSYSKSQKNLKIAVSVMDQIELPMIGSEVSLVIISPSGQKTIQERNTDHHGIAIFKVHCNTSGFSDIIVSNVSHPLFKIRFTRDSQRLLMVEL